MFTQLFQFSTTSWFLGGAIAGAICFFLLWRDRAKSWNFGLDAVLLSLFLVFFLVSFLFRLQPYGYQAFMSFAFGPLLYLVLQRSRFFEWSRKHSLKIAWTAAVLGVLFSLYGLAMFIYEHNPRVSSLFRGLKAFEIWPNNFALFLLMILPFNLYLCFKNTKNFGRLSAAACFVVNMAAFFLTFSRGAYLSLLASCFAAVFIVVILRWRFSQFVRLPVKKSVIILSLIAFGFILAASINEWHRVVQPPELAEKVTLTEDFFGRFANKGRGDVQSVNERTEFWKGGLQLIQQYPWFGVGANGFPFQYPRVQTQMLAAPGHSESLFLGLALENGFFAALFFLLFCVALYLKNFVVLLQGGVHQGAFKGALSENFYWILVVFVASVSAFLHIQLNYNIDFMILWLMFWLVLSMLEPFPPLKSISKTAIAKPLFNGIFLLLLFSFSAVNAWHIWEYRIVKSIENNLAANQLDNLTSSFQKLSEYAPFHNLRYELAGEYALQTNFDQETFLFFEDFVQKAVNKYPNWAEGHIALARIYASANRFDEAARSYEQGLDLNALNHLDWHLEYLQALQKANLTAKLREEASQYYQLMDAYEDKVKVNEHHTIASENPEKADAIFELYIDLLPDSEDHEWKKLHQNYEAVWQEEIDKFYGIYPSEKRAFK